MDASEPHTPARHEAGELGPEPPGGTEVELWREERWGAVVLLAWLADEEDQPSDPNEHSERECLSHRALRASGVVVGAAVVGA